MDREALKGTVSVISSEPPCKDDNERFTTVPLMIFIYTVYFNFWFFFLQKWVAHFLLIRNTEKKITELTLFQSEKTWLSSSFLIRLRFQGYRCKSEIAIFAWRVT